MVLRARPGRDEGEQAVVYRLAAARKAPKVLVERCRMVELSRDGWLVPQIAEELRCSQKTVRRLLHRYNRWGLEGLEDLGGQGRKRRVTETARSRIIAMVKQTPPGRLEVQPSNEMWAADESGPSEWTLDTLAAAARDRGIEVSRSQVRRILLAEGVRWRRTRSWTRSRDADFEGKDVPRAGEDLGLRPLRIRDGQELTLTAASRNSDFYQKFLQLVEDANP